MPSQTQKTYHRQTAKFLATIGENVPTNLNAEQMQAYIDNPQHLQRALQVLSHLLIGNDHKPILPWREFIIGGTPLEELIELVRPYKCDMSWEAIMRHEDFTLLSTPHRVITTIVTPGTLGFVKKPKLPALLARARECGLSWHPSLAAHVRLAYQDDPVDEQLNFLTDPIPDGDDRPSIFVIDRNDEDSPPNVGRFYWTIPGDTDEEDVREYAWGLDWNLVFIIGEPVPITA